MAGSILLPPSRRLLVGHIHAPIAAGHERHEMSGAEMRTAAKRGTGMQQRVRRH